MMIAIEILKNKMLVERISRAMDIPSSFIYYRKTERSGKRKSGISENIEFDIII